MAQSFEKNFYTEKSSYNLLSEEEHSKSKPQKSIDKWESVEVTSGSIKLSKSKNIRLNIPLERRMNANLKNNLSKSRIEESYTEPEV